MHLEIAAGKVEALVRGSSTYEVKLVIQGLARARWNAVIDECSGQVTSLVELLGGKLSHGVMEVVTHRTRGLFPSPKEISLSCSCPDWATMCKHVAAAMYGVGARLDREPELLFRLRGVDPKELVAKSVGRVATRASRPRARSLADDALGGIFGIEMDAAPLPVVAAKSPRARKPPAAEPTKPQRAVKKQAQRR